MKASTASALLLTLPLLTAAIPDNDNCKRDDDNCNCNSKRDDDNDNCNNHNGNNNNNNNNCDDNGNNCNRYVTISGLSPAATTNPAAVSSYASAVASAYAGQNPNNPGYQSIVSSIAAGYANLATDGPAYSSWSSAVRGLTSIPDNGARSSAAASLSSQGSSFWDGGNAPANPTAGTVVGAAEVTGGATVVATGGAPVRTGAGMAAAGLAGLLGGVAFVL